TALCLICSTQPNTEVSRDAGRGCCVRAVVLADAAADGVAPSVMLKIAEGSALDTRVTLAAPASGESRCGCEQACVSATGTGTVASTDDDDEPRAALSACPACLRSALSLSRQMLMAAGRAPHPLHRP